MLVTPLPRFSRPAHRVLVAAGGRADATRSKPALLLENALLRHQLLILRRTTERPTITAVDHGLLMRLASRLRT